MDKKDTEFDLKVLSLNCRGLVNNTKRKTLFHLIKNKNIDIAFLQETFVTPLFVKDFDRCWGGSAFHAASNSCHSRGVCILIKEGLDIQVQNVHRSEDGRKLMMNVIIKGSMFCLVCAYAPNVMAQRIEFFKRLSKWIKQKCCNDDKVIIGADLNAVDSPVDKVSGKLDASSSHFTNFKRFVHADDTFRYKNPTAIEYTYIDPSGRGMMSRIDYIMSTKYLTNSVKSIDICVAPVPDHKAVVAHFCSSNRPRGKGYWKLNSTLLESEEYREKVNTIIVDTTTAYEHKIPYKSLWDLIKIRIKEYSLGFGIKLSRIYKAAVSKLESKISVLDKTLANGYTRATFNERQCVKLELDKHLQQKACGAQIRSRARWVEEGERSTAYFTRLERQRQTYNKIDRLKSNDGEILDTDQEILKEASQFYASLYTSINPPCESIDDYLNETTFRKTLDEEAKSSCEGEITLEECTYVVQRLKHNKSPGIDGLTAEFYIAFWARIGRILLNVYNESYSDGILSDSQRISVLSLIFKKGD
jgi:exonuclease III